MIFRILANLGIAFCIASAGFAADAPSAGLGGKDATTFRPGPPEAAARYAGPDWQLYWGDEFDVAGLVNPERWTYEYGLVRNNELQFYTRERPENARVADGRLIITARREPWEKAGYTSASITSRGKFNLTYGKVEIRARIPTGRGAWPALWMLGNMEKYRWPKCGEIDLMENVGFDPQKIHFTTHTGAFNHVQGTQRGAAVTLDAPWQEFHRFGLIWTPQKLEYFLDGEKVSEFVNDGQGHDHWPFDEPHHLIMNLAIGGGWGGQKGIDDTIFPLEFEIDYVRVWKHAEKPATAAPGGIGLRPAIDPKRPRPRPMIVKRSQTAGRDNPTMNIGVTVINAKFSNHGAYLQRLVEGVQMEWDAQVAKAQVRPAAGGWAVVKFKLNANGEVAAIFDVQRHTTDAAAEICVAAIRNRAPYGVWTDEMRAELGESQELAFTFYYE